MGSEMCIRDRYGSMQVNATEILNEEEKNDIRDNVAEIHNPC